MLQTQNYEEKVFTYVGGVITDGGSGVIVDDDVIIKHKSSYRLCSILSQQMKVRLVLLKMIPEVRVSDFTTSGNPAQ